jgi:hypothetical protein
MTRGAEMTSLSSLLSLFCMSDAMSVCLSVHSIKREERGRPTFQSHTMPFVCLKANDEIAIEPMVIESMAIHSRGFNADS